jgi:hypothetical protein
MSRCETDRHCHRQVMPPVDDDPTLTLAFDRAMVDTLRDVNDYTPVEHDEETVSLLHRYTRAHVYVRVGSQNISIYEDATSTHPRHFLWVNISVFRRDKQINTGGL